MRAACMASEYSVVEEVEWKLSLPPPLPKRATLDAGYRCCGWDTWEAESGDGGEPGAESASEAAECGCAGRKRRTHCAVSDEEADAVEREVEKANKEGAGAAAPFAAEYLADADVEADHVALGEP
jgi:hypothetical protein